MGEAIEQGSGHLGIAEDARSFAEAEVRSGVHPRSWTTGA